MSLKQTWQTINPKTKRLLVVGSLTVMFFTAITILVQDDKPVVHQPLNTNPEIKLISSDKLDEFTIASLSNSVDQLRQTLNQQLEYQKKLQERLRSLEAELQQTKQANLTSETSQLNPLSSPHNIPSVSLSANEVGQRQQDLTDLLQLLEGLPPEEQCEVYAKYIQTHPQARNATIEQLIKFSPESQGLSPNPQSNFLSSAADFSKVKQPEAPEQETELDFPSQQIIQHNLAALQGNQPSAFATQPTANLTANPSINSLGVTPNYYANPSLTSLTPPSLTANSRVRIPKILTLTAAPSSSEQTQESGLEIPAGSVFTATLISGVDAPTSDGAKADPTPVLARLDNLDFLPNNYRINLASCFILLSAYGELSTERANMRTQSLSCINQQGRLVTGELRGYAVGEDGKIGIPGRLVSKQGSLLAKSLSIGFIQGISSLIRRPNLVLSGSEKVSDLKSILSQAGLNGADKALDRISNFYLTLANQMFPTVEIINGRKIDLILTTKATLTTAASKINFTPLQESKPASQVGLQSQLSYSLPIP